jgi:hypothetical protein
LAPVAATGVSSLGELEQAAANKIVSIKNLIFMLASFVAFNIVR